MPFKRFDAAAAASNTSAEYQAVRRPRRTPTASAARSTAKAAAATRAVVATTSGTNASSSRARPWSGRVAADTRLISAAHQSATAENRRVRCVQSVGVDRADHDAGPYGNPATVLGLRGTVSSPRASSASIHGSSSIVVRPTTSRTCRSFAASSSTQESWRTLRYTGRPIQLGQRTASSSQLPVLAMNRPRPSSDSWGMCVAPHTRPL